MAQFFGLPARQRYEPWLRLKRDLGFSTGTGTIIKCSHRTFDHGALDAALDSLMMQAESPANRKKRRVFPIGQ